MRAHRRGDPGIEALWWGGAAAAVLLMVIAELTRPLADPVVVRDVATLLPDDVRAQASAYRAPQYPATLLSLTLRAAVGVAVLSSRRIRRALTGRLAERFGGRPLLGPLAAGGAAAAVWAASDLLRLPIGIWSFLRARDVGLAVQSLPAWLRDWLVQSGPVWLGLLLGVAALVWLADRLPRLWVPLGGLLGGLVGVVLILLSPLLLEPLVLNFTPVEDPVVREAVTSLVQAAEGQPPSEVLVADASRITTATNAYVSGLGGTRRVVLYDTLLQERPLDDVLAILAHEVAHQAHADVERSAMATVGGTVAVLMAIAFCLRGRLRDADGTPRLDAGTKAVALALILVVVLTPLESWSSRRAESAADERAIELTGDGAAYAAMMEGLARTNLSDPSPPVWAVTLLFSHPPVVERISRGLAADASGAHENRTSS